MSTTKERPLALVTGASSGIGLELARQFAEHGYDLILAAEDGGLENAATRLKSTRGPAGTRHRRPDQA